MSVVLPPWFETEDPKYWRDFGPMLRAGSWGAAVMTVPNNIAVGNRGGVGDRDATETRILNIRSRIADSGLIGLSLLTPPALAVSLLRSLEIGWQPIMALHIVIAAGILGVTLFRRRLLYGARAGFLVVILLVVGAAGYVSFGLVSMGPLFFLSAGIVAFLLIGIAAGAVVSFATVVAHGAVFALFDSGVLVPNLLLGEYAQSISAWSASGVGMALVGAGVGAALAVFSRHMMAALQYETRERQSLSDLIASVPDGILVVDRKGMIQQVNRHAETVFGYGPGELVGQSVERLVLQAYRSVHAEHVSKYATDGAFRTMAADRIGLEGLRKDGSVFPIQVSLGRFSGPDHQMSVAVFRDLTERLALERKLREAQKMEAVGELTGGVAHHFNNLMAVVSGNAELLKEKIGDDPMLNPILRAATRGGELTQRLLAFSRRQVLDTKPLYLNAFLPAVGDLLERRLDESVRIQLRVPDDTWPVLADPRQLENALLNLAINARDAMPDGGSLEISCRNLESQAARTRASADIVAGDFVEIAVRDTGVGMTREVLERAFEPFFTTKAAGAGGGLGLSMVYGFARQSGGDALIESTVGEGTEVRILLPRAAPGVAQASSEQV